LYPTTDENFLHCIPQWREISSVVSHNGRKPSSLYPTMEGNAVALYPATAKKTKNINNYTSINFSAKRSKTSWYCPFKVTSHSLANTDG
jgi:hypothetical protein